MSSDGRDTKADVARRVGERSIGGNEEEVRAAHGLRRREMHSVEATQRVRISKVTRTPCERGQHVDGFHVPPERFE